VVAGLVQSDESVLVVIGESDGDAASRELHNAKAKVRSAIANSLHATATTEVDIDTLLSRVTFKLFPTDDSWLRDSGPTCVLSHGEVSTRAIVRRYAPIFRPIAVVG
jgi:agmatine/peptidylarginine deiminase